MQAGTASTWDFGAVHAEVDFAAPLRPWDGFGVNYVETAQTTDYAADPQEYGGLSLLTEGDRERVLDLVFGSDGLRPGLIKMFLDPWHQTSPDVDCDHRHSTRWMRTFVAEGLRRTRARGADLTVITTLYGPPPWATRQGFLRGRDLDPDRRDALARYLVDWVRFLRREEGIPVRFLSLHNEGEDWRRWPEDGTSGNIGKGHDYNLFWPPDQVVDFLQLLRPVLDAQGLEDVGITPGECSNWYRFQAWGYADTIARNPRALRNLALITSHGFYNGAYGRWFGEHCSAGIDTLRAQRPDLHAWVTSTSWSRMDADFIKEIHGNIYTAKVNGVIPWACMQRPSQWVGGDPNPGCAFRVAEDGGLEVCRGYHYFRQVSRAGQPGMAVVRTAAMDSEIALIGFAGAGSGHPDAFVLANLAKAPRTVAVTLRGSSAARFAAFRTTDGGECCRDLGVVASRDGMLRIEAPPRSATTFFAAGADTR
ncbi:MAG: hypothetical protein JXR77_11325 [Lentisphaeria bacterium]|nr:hypothetical protein [Lentisphaeria bacterium]